MSIFGSARSLDRVFQHLGNDPDAFRRWFRELAERDAHQAARALDGRYLSFPVLFLLLGEIPSLIETGGLSQPILTAVRICELHRSGKADELTAYLKLQDSEVVRQVAKWMLETGHDWNAPAEIAEEYDAALDLAVALLVCECNDNTELPIIADLIFKRANNGKHLHNLVWYFFQSYNPEAVRIIAGRLISNDPSEREFAKKLLGLSGENSADPGGPTDPYRQYEDYMRWLDDNSNALYFTGQTLQMTSDPEPLKADLGAKYLCKAISPRDRTWVEPLNEQECNCLDNFRKLTDKEKEVLAAFSSSLYRNNRRVWEQWIALQPDIQIRTAMTLLGDFL
ncbi:MAG: hypothetical protein GX193_05520 [Clostridiales bacterium]|nr:hypothetical protein [Clostridiales bacterium]